MLKKTKFKKTTPRPKYTITALNNHTHSTNQRVKSNNLQLEFYENGLCNDAVYYKKADQFKYYVVARNKYYYLFDDDFLSLTTSKEML